MDKCTCFVLRQHPGDKRFKWFAHLLFSSLLFSQKRKVRPTTVRLISAVLSILIGCLIFLAVPTFVFLRVENWSLPEAFYFVVITLTTVGFGDYVPGSEARDPEGKY